MCFLTKRGILNQNLAQLQNFLRLIKHRIFNKTWLNSKICCCGQDSQTKLQSLCRPIWELGKVFVENPMLNNEHIWYKKKLTRRPPCFVVEIFLVDGVRDTTFKVPINMKIYICKIQYEAVIIILKNKSQNDFLTPCTMRQHGGWKLYKKYDVSLNWSCSANKRSTVKILDIFRICRACWFSRTPNFKFKKQIVRFFWKKISFHHSLNCFTYMYTAVKS